MGVVIEISVKYPGGPTRIAVADIYIYTYQWLRIGFHPQLFYTYFYNHAHRLRLEKLLYLELPRSPNGFF